jgi:hypothetical protein
MTTARRQRRERIKGNALRRFWRLGGRPIAWVRVKWGKRWALHVWSW